MIRRGIILSAGADIATSSTAFQTIRVADSDPSPPLRHPHAEFSRIRSKCASFAGT
jgi:hypothetical protein